MLKGSAALSATRGDGARRFTGTREVVGATGFEPATPCAQGRCATRLRYAPTPPIIARAPHLARPDSVHRAGPARPGVDAVNGCGHKQQAAGRAALILPG
jgi:hypothetical protein